MAAKPRYLTTEERAMFAHHLEHVANINPEQCPLCHSVGDKQMAIGKIFIFPSLSLMRRRYQTMINAMDQAIHTLRRRARRADTSFSLTRALWALK